MALHARQTWHAGKTARTRGAHSTRRTRGAIIAIVTVLAGNARHAAGSWGSGGAKGAWITGFTTHALEPLGTGWTWRTWASSGTDGADLGLQVVECSGANANARALLAALGLGELREPRCDVRHGSGWSRVAGDSWGTWRPCLALFTLGSLRALDSRGGDAVARLRGGRPDKIWGWWRLLWTYGTALTERDILVRTLDLWAKNPGAIFITRRLFACDSPGGTEAGSAVVRGEAVPICVPLTLKLASRTFILASIIVVVIVPVLVIVVVFILGFWIGFWLCCHARQDNSHQEEEAEEEGEGRGERGRPPGGAWEPPHDAATLGQGGVACYSRRPVRPLGPVCPRQPASLY